MVLTDALLDRCWAGKIVQFVVDKVVVEVINATFCGDSHHDWSTAAK